MSSVVNKAIKLLSEGKPIFIYDFDSREGEVDFVIRAKFINEDWIKWMRIHAGGLICFVTSYEIGKILGIDLQVRYLAQNSQLKDLVKKPRYGDEPAFSIYVNHIDVKTGIRDSDRALTIRKLCEVIEKIHNGLIDDGRKMFHQEFYSPGHIPILLGRIGERWGHTELSLILAKIANFEPALTIVEMLGESSDALSISDVEKIASKLGTVVVKGEDIIEYARKLRIIEV